MNQLKLFLAAAFLLSAQLVAAQNSAPLKLAAKYDMPASVKGRFDHLGIDIGGKRLFVVGEEAQQVLVFDLADGKFVRARNLRISSPDYPGLPCVRDLEHDRHERTPKSSCRLPDQVHRFSAARRNW